MGAAPFPSSIPADRMDQVRARYVRPDPGLPGYAEFYYVDTGEVIPAALAEDLPVPMVIRWQLDSESGESSFEILEDVGPEEFHRCTKAVGKRLSELTGISRRRAESLAVEVCGCVRLLDEDGALSFRDGRGRVVVRRPYAEFADVLRWDEEGEGAERSPFQRAEATLDAIAQAVPGNFFRAESAPKPGDPAWEAHVKGGYLFHFGECRYLEMFGEEPSAETRAVAAEIRSRRGW